MSAGCLSLNKLKFLFWALINQITWSAHYAAWQKSKQPETKIKFLKYELALNPPS